MCIYSHDNALPVFGLRGVWVSWMFGGCWMLKTWEMESWISVVVLTLIGLTDGRTMSPPDKIRYNWVLWYTHVCVVHIYVGIHMYLYTQMLLSGVWGCWMLRLWAMVSWISKGEEELPKHPSFPSKEINYIITASAGTLYDWDTAFEKQFNWGTNLHSA